MKRNNKDMKWMKCKDCGGRIYLHRPDSHECNYNLTVLEADDEFRKLTDNHTKFFVPYANDTKIELFRTESAAEKFVAKMKSKH